MDVEQIIKTIIMRCMPQMKYLSLKEGHSNDPVVNFMVQTENRRLRRHLPNEE
jgi:hypothetical protein